MGKIKLILGAFILLLVSGQANAAIIDNGTYTTINGYDWLDLTATTGITIQQALAQNVGYDLATKTQFQAMFSEFETFGDGMFLHDYSSTEFRWVTEGYTEHTVDNGGNRTYFFGELFGYTEIKEFTVDTLGWYAEGGIQRLGGVNLLQGKSR